MFFKLKIKKKVYRPKTSALASSNPLVSNLVLNIRPIEKSLSPAVVTAFNKPFEKKFK